MLLNNYTDWLYKNNKHSNSSDNNDNDNANNNNHNKFQLLKTLTEIKQTNLETNDYDSTHSCPYHPNLF